MEPQDRAVLHPAYPAGAGIAALAIVTQTVAPGDVTAGDILPQFGPGFAVGTVREGSQITGRRISKRNIDPVALAPCQRQRALGPDEAFEIGGILGVTRFPLR
ncbi:hypothetical protein LY632_13105 [Erythrobacter sp. SDW2]|uniref:hypothetical protein n=1 Tax=Erythrobacter sp. SDW2 TaxID=2907154 RepID=UPI001F46069B|nr:hypothetical protein [Erythrobacter sp. SDW2]UIP06608.1 hypothetical protein LY632_13105 [Erythrobacter sp. SDW2]